MIGVTLVLMTGFSRSAFGLATEQIGPDSKARPALPQPGWASGLVEVPRHGSRVYSIWVNGAEAFYFNAEMEGVADLVRSFSKIRLRDHIVEVKAGEPEIKSLRGRAFEYNVSFNVASGIALHRRFRKVVPAETFEPVLTVHVRNARERAALEALEWPDNVIIRNSVSGLSLTSQVQEPKRLLWYASVKFEDGTPAFARKMSTTVTLWEKGQSLGFDLGRVSYKGQFLAAFSDKEIARLKSGDMWLTMTVGDYKRTPVPSHSRLDVESLVLNPDDAQPVTVSRFGF